MQHALSGSLFWNHSVIFITAFFEIPCRLILNLMDGESLSCKPVKFTRGDIIEFGKKYDPQIFHIDENAAHESIFRGLIACRPSDKPEK